MITEQKYRLTQLALFEEHLTIPNWCDLGETARNEVVRYLAQLLSSVQARGTDAQFLGGQDE